MLPPVRLELGISGVSGWCCTSWANLDPFMHNAANRALLHLKYGSKNDFASKFSMGFPIFFNANFKLSWIHEIKIYVTNIF